MTLSSLPVTPLHALPLLQSRSEPSPSGGPPVVAVNFDPELVKLLREVHDFMLLPSLPADIPEPAVKARWRWLQGGEEVGKRWWACALMGGW